MQETSTTSGGLCGQLQEKHEDGSKEYKFDQPLALTAFFSIVYICYVLSFVPPQLHRYLAVFYTVQEIVFGSNTVIRFVACLTLFLHVVEAAYARHLALKVDPDNVLRWVLGTAFYGLGTLRHLIAKANARKLE